MQDVQRMPCSYLLCVPGLCPPCLWEQASLDTNLFLRQAVCSWTREPAGSPLSMWPIFSPALPPGLSKRHMAMSRVGFRKHSSG